MLRISARAATWRTLLCGMVVAALVWCGGPAACQENALKTFGTGFVVDGRGYVLTNEHVVHRAKNVQVTTQGGDAYAALLECPSRKMLLEHPVEHMTDHRRPEVLVKPYDDRVDGVYSSYPDFAAGTPGRVVTEEVTDCHG